tara:strand:+ start:5767 stop:6438 length:672 start_codon:yes stop_codon:yes gene_type:complete
MISKMPTIHKTKKIYLIILILLMSVSSYLYQITFVKKSYVIKTVLKKNITLDKFFKSLPEDINLIQQENSLNEEISLILKNRLLFEVENDPIVLKIYEYCKKVKIKTNKQYYQAQCTTYNPSKVVELNNHLIKIITKAHYEYLISIYSSWDLNSESLIQKTLSDNDTKFITSLKFSSKYQKNRLQNIINIHLIIFFITILYFYIIGLKKKNISKFKKKKRNYL